MFYKLVDLIKPHSTSWSHVLLFFYPLAILGMRQNVLQDFSAIRDFAKEFTMDPTLVVREIAGWKHTLLHDE